MCIPYHNTETCSRSDHNKLNWIFKTQSCSRYQWNTFNKSSDIVPFLKQLNGLHLLPLLWKITMKGNPIMLNILIKIKQSKLKLESQSFSFFYILKAELQYWMDFRHWDKSIYASSYVILAVSECQTQLISLSSTFSCSKSNIYLSLNKNFFLF